MKNQNDVVVNIFDHSKSQYIEDFTEKHLDIVKGNPEKGIDPLMDWVRIFPELFGYKLPQEIYFAGFYLLPLDAVDFTHQKYRVGGSTRGHKLLEIRQNIERNGYKLKYPPPAWFEWSLNNYSIITGNTRGYIVHEAGKTHMVVAVYKRNDGFTDDQVEDAVDRCGLRFNSIHDPAEPISKEDVKRGVQAAIERYIKTNGKAGCANTMEAIEERVDEVCGEGVFQPATRLLLIQEIYNNFNPHDIVIAWSNAKKAKFRIEKFLKDAKLVDTDTVKYLVTSYENVVASYAKAVRMFKQHPKAKIRIILHTGILSGYHLEKTYVDRFNSYVSIYNEILTNTCFTFFDKPNPDRNPISIYGLLPALSSAHSLEQIFLYNERTDFLYQKDGKQYDLNEVRTDIDYWFNDDDDKD